MSLPFRIDHCPLSLTCSVPGLWKDPDTDKIYTFNTSTQQYRPHTCMARTVVLPTVAFGSKWVSKATGNVRIIGPVRLEKSALIPPPDSFGSAKNRAKRKGENEWLFDGLSQASLTWEPIDVPEHYKEEFFAEFTSYQDYLREHEEGKDSDETQEA